MATAHDDSWMENPVFAGRDPTLLSTYSAPLVPLNKPRKAPPAIGRIVAELGLRYRPSNQADLAAHAEALLLLTLDLADVPPHLLEQAAERWVRSERFMPRASELIDLAQRIQRGERVGTDQGARQLADHCAHLNAMNIDWHWEVRGVAPNRFVHRVR